MSKFEEALSALFHDKGDLLRPELILIYGSYGSGKTHLATSICEVEGPTLILDCEGSTTGVATKFDPDLYEVIRVADHAEPGDEWGVFSEIVNGVLTEKTRFKSLVIDPISTVFDWALSSLEDDLAARKSGDKYAVWRDVHSELTATRGLIDRLKNSHLTTVMVSHEESKEVGKSGDRASVLRNFQWSGKGKDRLGQFPDMVLHTSRKATKSGAVTQIMSVGNDEAQAKTRFDLPLVMDNWTMKDIYETILSTKAQDVKSNKERATNA